MGHILSSNTYKSFLLLIIPVSIFAIPVFAEQPLGSILMVETDPYYFSEGDLGLKLLKFFQRPLSPYLIPGKTTEQSTIQEISEAYNEANPSVEQKAIVDDNNRAMTYVVEFSGGDLQKPYRFDTFQKFTPITKDQSNSPYYYQNLQYGLELESLPSEDKKLFYDNLVIPSINPGKKPEPFDVTIDVLTGDGVTLQSWKYRKCIINSYTPYLDENLVKLKFVGDFVSEIKDKTAFSCDGFAEDFSLKPSKKTETTLFPTIPTKETRAERIIAQFSGGELKNTATFYSFSKFTPLAKNPTFPISIPGNVIGEKPRFALESLPTTDKESYYAFLSRYINAGKAPEPFDATIHLITGNGNILQSWQYKDCSANNYVIFFSDNLIRFKQSLGSEIRDKTYFECSGLSLDENLDESDIDTKPISIDKHTSAQTFVVHLQGSDIIPERTVYSFTKFFPITNEEIQFLLPNSPFGKEPKFYLESLPSKDNEWYYQLMSKYINAGKIPEPFDVTVDVLVGDGTKLQSLEYKKCQVLEYKTYLEDSLLIRKFTNKFEKEFRDRTIFQCVGYAFDATLHKPQNPLEKPLDYSDFVPLEQSRITQMITTFSNGDLEKPLVVNTIGKFTPKIEQRHQTQTQVIKFDVTKIPDAESGGTSPTTFGSPDYCEPGQNPPGCRPCPPNNPHCSDDGGNGGDGECEDTECITDPPIEPEEPGISTPSYTVLVTMPHLSTTQKNDYIKSTEFTLMSLPSKDKLPYYDMVSKYINPGKKPELFDVTLDYLSDDGTIIQSWQYSSCEIKDFKIKRNDILFTYPLSNMTGAADIVETSTLSCNGFSVDFDQKNSNSEVNSIIPTPYDRAMLHLIHWYGGELQNPRSSALLQEFNTLDDLNIFVGGLPNIHHKDAYQFVSRYINPGDAPEPTDMRFDTVTGDGTILFSTVYDKCTIKDASTYLSDNLILIRYTSSLKSEIHGNSLIDCVGTTFKVSPQNDSKFDYSGGNLRKVSPIIQTSIGVPAEDVSCKEGFTLMIRPPNNVPICMKNDSKSQFEERGWKVPSQKEKKNIADILRPILPSDSERALSFTIIFEGTDISPSQTVETFSKFIPISDEDSIIQTPSNPLDSSSKAFYLESLPSKEKNWFYELASRYVNAGAEPEKFNVTVEVNDGKEGVLQNWNYRECEITEFTTYYDDNLLLYKFHGKWQSEIKDKSIFRCAGLTINS